MIKLAVVASTAVLLCGCQTFRSPPPPVSADGFCALGLFLPDEGAEERWTLAEMRSLVAYNQTAEKLCGISPHDER